MSRRRSEGSETWSRLREWDRGQLPAERLAAHLIRIEGFTSIDPSHPLGGRDGLKDIICQKEGLKWVGAAYFPRGQKTFRSIRNKFTNDLAGVSANKVQGFVFVTNQELTLKERDVLKQAAGTTLLELFHLERIASILDTPPCYGLRLEFLDIEMTKEEQVAFFSTVTNVVSIIGELQNQLRNVLEALNNGVPSNEIPVEELSKFKYMLESIVGTSSLESGIILSSSPIGRLRVPLEELMHFKKALESIVGPHDILISSSLIGRLRVPLNELKEFESILTRLVGESSPFSIVLQSSPVQKLQVPLNSLHEYEQTLDGILQKLKILKEANPK